MITNPDQLKMISEAKIVKKSDTEEKKTIGEKIRGAWHSKVFNDKNASDNSK